MLCECLAIDDKLFALPDLFALDDVFGLFIVYVALIDYVFFLSACLPVYAVPEIMHTSCVCVCNSNCASCYESSSDNPQNFLFVANCVGTNIACIF